MLVPDLPRADGDEEGGGDDDPAPEGEPEADEGAGDKDLKEAHEMLGDGDEEEGGNVEEKGDREEGGGEEGFLGVDDVVMIGQEAKGGYQEIAGVELDVAVGHAELQEKADEGAREQGGSAPEKELTERRITKKGGEEFHPKGRKGKETWGAGAAQAIKSCQKNGECRVVGIFGLCKAAERKHTLVGL